MVFPFDLNHSPPDKSTRRRRAGGPTIWLSILLLLTECIVKAQSTGATGGGQAYSNLKPTLTLRCLLSMQGAYPGQSDGTLQQSDRSVPLLGEIRVVAFSNTPSGFAECSGQIVNISQNTALFSILLTVGGSDRRKQLPMSSAHPFLRSDLA